jgi:hypothetical protein
MKHELQNIISGKSQVRHGDAIQAIASYVRRGKSTSSTLESNKQVKIEEAKNIKKFCDQNSFWCTEIEITAFVSSGAEQRVYLHNEFQVFKLNDSIYYLSWEDYFNNLLLNNYFFPDTAYQLVGFYESEDVLYAVIVQDFIKSDHETALENVEKFLGENGFNNTRNNDYFNPDLGIILEDLHDENVLTFQGIMYFIDTVFYITPEFYQE